MQNQVSKRSIVWQIQQVNGRNCMVVCSHVLIHLHLKAQDW